MGDVGRSCGLRNLRKDTSQFGLSPSSSACPTCPKTFLPPSPSSSPFVFISLCITQYIAIMDRSSVSDFYKIIPCPTAPPPAFRARLIQYLNHPIHEDNLREILHSIHPTFDSAEVTLERTFPFLLQSGSGCSLSDLHVEGGPAYEMTGPRVELGRLRSAAKFVPYASPSSSQSRSACPSSHS